MTSASADTILAMVPPDTDQPSADEGAPLIASLEARVAELEAEVVALKVDLWAARDAAIGATAEVGTHRVQRKELESLIHQLRLQVAALGGSGRKTPGMYVDKVARRLVRLVR